MKLTLAALAVPLVLAACASGSPGSGGHHYSSSSRAEAGGPTSAEVQAHRQHMQAMQERMQAARTPEERTALIAEQRELMQQDPALRGRRSGGMGMGTGSGMGNGMGQGPGMGMSGSTSGTGSLRSWDGLDSRTVDREVDRSPGP